MSSQLNGLPIAVNMKYFQLTGIMTSNDVLKGVKIEKDRPTHTHNPHYK